jgi:hypothetical protein
MRRIIAVFEEIPDGERLRVSKIKASLTLLSVV